MYLIVVFLVRVYSKKTINFEQSDSSVRLNTTSRLHQVGDVMDTSRNARSYATNRCVIRLSILSNLYSVSSSFLLLLHMFERHYPSCILDMDLMENKTSGLCPPRSRSDPPSTRRQSAKILSANQS